jgi:hypothetical protein
VGYVKSSSIKKKALNLFMVKGPKIYSRHDSNVRPTIYESVYLTIKLFILILVQQSVYSILFLDRYYHIAPCNITCEMLYQ